MTVRPASAVGSVSWTVAARWSALLGARVEATTGQWTDAAGGQLVKQGAGRVVYRVDFPAQSFFVKRFVTRGLLPSLRRWWRGSPAAREYDQGLALLGRGMPTAEPVAVGQRRLGRLATEDYVVTAAIPQAVSLYEYVAAHLNDLPRDTQRRRRRRLLGALASLLAAAHEAGVVHNDLHGGNVLVSLVDAERPRLFLIDVAGVKTADSASWPARRQNLVMLNADWRARATPAERRWFLRRYLRACRPGTAPPLRHAAAEVVADTRAYSCRLMLRRNKRALATNRDFFRLPVGQGRLHATQQLTPAEAAAWCASLERSHDGPTLVLADAAGPLESQRCPGRRWFEVFLQPMLRHPALATWVQAHGLLARGIAVRRPLLVWTPAHHAQGDGWLLYERRAEAQRLRPYLDSLALRPRREGVARAMQVAASLGRWLGRLHAWRGAGAPALNVDDFLIVERPQGVEILLDDAIRVRWASRVRWSRGETPRHWQRDVERLYHRLAGYCRRSRTVRQAFLRGYVSAWEPMPAKLLATLGTLVEIPSA